ncbi:hypothetical protein EAGG_00678 [Escherichia coli H588]|nr:hypothetical protein EAGG_00678 [Escherichia coli H588]
MNAQQNAAIVHCRTGSLEKIRHLMVLLSPCSLPYRQLRKFEMSL